MKRSRLNLLLGRKLTKKCKIPVTKEDGTVARDKDNKIKLRSANNFREFKAYYGKALDSGAESILAKLNDPNRSNVQNFVNKINIEIKKSAQQAASIRKQNREKKKDNKQKKMQEQIDAKATKKAMAIIKQQQNKKNNNQQANQNNNQDTQNNNNDNPDDTPDFLKDN